MKNFYIILILIFSFTIFSCAKKSDTSSTTTTTTELEGIWKTICHLDSDNISYIRTVTVSGTDAVETTEAHTDSSCANDWYKWDDSYSSLSIEDEVTFNDGTKGHKYTLNVASKNFTPQSSSYVSSLNSLSTCGYSDWTLNTSKDLAGVTCAAGTYYLKNTTGKGLYNLVGNNLFLGGFNTTGSYPTGVTTTIIYVKQ